MKLAKLTETHGDSPRCKINSHCFSHQRPDQDAAENPGVAAERCYNRAMENSKLRNPGTREAVERKPRLKAEDRRMLRIAAKLIESHSTLFALLASA